MINLYDILDAADGQLFGDPVAQTFNGFCIDPHQVQPGDLFVALKTLYGDGHDHMESALARGATGLMCTHPPAFDTEQVTVVIMRDAESALLSWTAYILQKYGTGVVALAGSQEKATAAAALATVLDGSLRVHLRQVDMPGRFGIPLALSRMPAPVDLAVLVYAPQGAGDMLDMLSVAPPMVAVILHMPDDPNAVDDLRALVAALPEDGLAVLNFDAAAARHLASDCAAPTFMVSVDRDGTSFGADLTAYNIVVSLDKTGFDLRYGSQRYVAHWVSLLGAHQLYAVLAALSVGLAYDIPLETGLQRLMQLAPLPGRLCPLTGLGGALVVDDTHDASETTLHVALDWMRAVRPAPSARQTQVGGASPAGQMLIALGDIAIPQPAALKALGARLASLADGLITQGDDAARIAHAAIEAGLPAEAVQMTYSARDSAAVARARLGPRDVILVAGEAAARMDQVVVPLLEDPADAVHVPRAGHVLSAPQQRLVHHTTLRIDIDVIAHNLRQVSAHVGPSCAVMAVVKHNAYGHGLLPVATTAALNGADYLGVLTVDDALRLRAAGITLPVLVLNYVAGRFAARVVGQGIAVTLFDAQIARELNRIASSMRDVLAVHVRVDCGAGGFGVPLDALASFFRALARLEWLKLEGIYTTLAPDDLARARLQLGHFSEAVRMLQAGDIHFQYVHAAGSQALWHLPESHLSMVRCGSWLYGIPPEGESTLPEGFQPALGWRTEIAQLKQVHHGLDIDEHGRPMPPQQRTLAVLPLGYMDGLRRVPGEATQDVLVRGQRATLAPDIGPYTVLADVTHVPDVRVGDEVILIGQQDAAYIPLTEVATRYGLSPRGFAASLTVPLTLG
ncbi:MAG: alanine racemase [Anaerolineales bacterium]